MSFFNNDLYFVKVGYDIVGVTCSRNDMSAIHNVLHAFGFDDLSDYENAYPRLKDDMYSNIMSRFTNNDRYIKIKYWNEPLYSAKEAVIYGYASPAKRISISNTCCDNINNMYVFPMMRSLKETFKTKHLCKKLKPYLWYCLDWDRW